MSKFQFTESRIKKLEPDPKCQIVHWDTKTTGLGIRLSPGGTKTFFYQGRLNGKPIKRTIGKHVPEVFTVAKATTCAKRIIGEIAQGIDSRPAKVNKGSSCATLGDLMNAYGDLLESQGKVSARNVRNQILADIERPHPNIWSKHAMDIDLDDCMVIVGAVRDAGKPRQADKIRSYLRTAFSEAINARGDVNMPVSMRNLNITHNPARDIRKVKGSSRAKDRALSVKELQAYWRHVQKLPTPQRQLASLHVITGGQRQKQLSRVTWADIDLESRYMVIMDRKGRRDVARRHIVPLLTEAIDAMASISGNGGYVFSCNGGKSPINDRYLPSIASKICESMRLNGELEGAPFTAGAIRATIETRLMKQPYRVSSDVLGQLLSHGMGGVQQKHYHHDSFEEEKLDALNKLWRLVNNTPEPAAQVIPFKAGDAVGP